MAASSVVFPPRRPWSRSSSMSRLPVARYCSAAALLMIRSMPPGASSFAVPSPPFRPRRPILRAPTTTTVLSMAVVPPSPTSTVGVVGRGYLPTLVSKLASIRGYETWTLCPPGEIDTMTSLMTEPDAPLPENLKLIESTDSEGLEAALPQTDALIVAVDGDGTMDESVLDYLLNPSLASNVKRVVGMSRNLNGEGMGFFVSASKKTANAEVWDNSNAQSYRTFENNLKDKCQTLGAEYTIVRAGTLKGGGCGDETRYDDYLTTKFYELTKKDIVTWQLLFDCKVRGVTLAKGDVMVGPGAKAVFTATGTDRHDGDTGRCGLAEAMVRSLNVENAGNVDFGVGTKEGRVPPTEEEWEELFGVLG